MPIVIDEMIAEVSDGATSSSEWEPLQQQLPAALAEQELLHTLALVQQRQDRLRVD